MLEIMLERKRALLWACMIAAWALIGNGAFGGLKCPAGKVRVLASKKVKGKTRKLSKQQKEKAAQYHQMGLTLYKKGMYKEAVEYFIKAVAIDDDPSTLFNIARCYENIYKYVKAYAYYKQYVESGNESRIGDAREAMTRIEEMPVMLKVVSFPDGASVFIDGEIVKFQRTPVIAEVKAGKHKIVIEKDGFATVEKLVNIPFGGEGKIDVVLEKGKGKKKGVVVVGETGMEGEEEIEEEVEEEPVKVIEKVTKKVRKPRGPVPFSISIAAGATVSTTKKLGSFIDASLAVSYRIKQGFVGLGIDNLFFTDSYLLAVYPAGGYTLRVWRDLSIQLAAGFGFAWFIAFKDGGDEDGNIAIKKGGSWDLVAHAGVRIRYKVGPVLIQVVPIHVDILMGAGSLDPSPLAQFAFLAGIAYDF